MATLHKRYKRWNGISWDEILIAPATHTHDAADVASGTLADARIPALAISKITNLQSTLDGKAATSHTHNPTQIVNATYSMPGNMTTLRQPLYDFARSNRLAFINPALVTIEYTDDGSVWTNYGASDAQKVGFFSGLNTTLYIGANVYNAAGYSENSKTRITLDAWSATGVNERYFGNWLTTMVWVSTSGSVGMNVTIEASTIGAPDTFTTIVSNVALSGWSGPNEIGHPGMTYGGGTTQTNQYRKVRFTFSITGVGSWATYGRASIMQMRAYSTSVWTTPNNLMNIDHLYTWSWEKNALFPGELYAGNSWSNKVYHQGFKPSWSDIQSKPTVIIEGDARLTNARVASDVYAWAKAASKPTYTYSEVGAAASAHDHSVTDIFDLDTYLEGATVAYAYTAGSASANDVYTWAKASTKPTYSLDELNGVVLTSPSPGHVLVYDVAGYFKNIAPPWASASHSHNASDINAGVMAVARLGTGTPDATKYLRGDGTWSTVSASADGMGLVSLVAWFTKATGSSFSAAATINSTYSKIFIQVFTGSGAMVDSVIINKSSSYQYALGTPSATFSTTIMVNGTSRTLYYRTNYGGDTFELYHTHTATLYFVIYGMVG